MLEKYKPFERLCNTTKGIVTTINRCGLTQVVNMRKQLLRIAEASGETYKLESFVIDGQFLLHENGSLHRITYPKPTRTPTTRFVMTTKEFMESRRMDSFISKPYI